MRKREGRQKSLPYSNPMHWYDWPKTVPAVTRQNASSATEFYTFNLKQGFLSLLDPGLLDTFALFFSSLQFPELISLFQASTKACSLFSSKETDSTLKKAPLSCIGTQAWTKTAIHTQTHTHTRYISVYQFLQNGSSSVTYLWVSSNIQSFFLDSSSSDS